jgi:hypothetical protein
LYAPLLVRITGVSSELATPKLLTADRGQPGPGAILDFTPLLENGRLLPDEKTGGKDLVIRLDDLRPLWQGGHLKNGLAAVDFRVFVGKEKE